VFAACSHASDDQMKKTKINDVLSSIGTKFNLPQDVREIADLRSEVTETDLEIVTRNHDECCFPNVRQSGDTVQTIPLENITTSLMQSQTGRCCRGEIPVVKIYTPSRAEVDENDRPKAPSPAAVGVGLSRHDWFMGEVFSQRGILSKNLPASTWARAVPACSPMERSDFAPCRVQISSSHDKVSDSRKRNNATAPNDCIREAEILHRPCFGSNSDGLPESICEAAQLAGRNVIAWVTLDRSCDRGLDCGCCYYSLFPFYYLFPLLALFGFLSLAISALVFALIARLLYRYSRGNRYWILTDSDLREVSDGVLTAAISLPSITRCRITTRGKGCLDRHVALSSTICVETASDEDKERSIGASDLAECKWFIREVLNQRNCMKCNQCDGLSIVEMDGVVGRSMSNRVEELSELLESGLLTQSELDEKRREGVNSI
jgi:hypothetical protein